MTIRRTIHATTMLATLTILCVTATAANAIDSCKVKVDKKTGVILVDATTVGGPLLWGAESGQENTAMFNAGTCVAAGKAKKCQLADPLTLAAKTSPSGCTMYLDDGVASCSAWIPGCTPGQRNSSGALVKDSTGALIGYVADSYGQVALHDEAGVTLRLPLSSDGSGFYASGYLYYLSSDCSGSTLMQPDTSMVRGVVAVSNSIGYYPPTSGTLQISQSFLPLLAFTNDQPTCDAAYGPGTTFIAPHGCCFTAPNANQFGTALSFNLGQFVVPFAVDVQ